MTQDTPAALLGVDFAIEWLRNNYQDHANLASLCDALRLAALSAQAAPTEAAAMAATVPDPDGWLVKGGFTRATFAMRSSAEAFMSGLLKEDPDGAYQILPLYTQAPVAGQPAEPSPAKTPCQSCGGTGQWAPTPLGADQCDDCGGTGKSTRADGGVMADAMEKATAAKRMHCAGRCKVTGIFDFDGALWSCRNCGWLKRPTAAEKQARDCAGEKA